MLHVSTSVYSFSPPISLCSQLSNESIWHLRITFFLINWRGVYFIVACVFLFIAFLKTSHIQYVQYDTVWHNTRWYHTIQLYCQFTLKVIFHSPAPPLKKPSNKLLDVQLHTVELQQNYPRLCCLQPSSTLEEVLGRYILTNSWLRVVVFIV